MLFKKSKITHAIVKCYDCYKNNIPYVNSNGIYYQPFNRINIIMIYYQPYVPGLPLYIINPYNVPGSP